MANLQGTTVTGDLAVTGATSGQGAVPIGAVLPVVTALTGSHTIPNTGTVDADGWQYCDGAVIPGSQTLSGTTPNLTDGRFLRGFTTSSGCGGSATFTLAEGNLAAHNHGGATTSASTTPGAGGSTTPGATGGCGQTTASTTPGAGSACSATTGSCGQTTSATCPAHTHYGQTAAISVGHCHCICDAGTHSHSITAGSSHSGTGYGTDSSQTDSPFGSDSRYHCAQWTCAQNNNHCHAGATNSCGGNHTHTTPSHSHSIPSHTHTGAAHTHTTPSHTHTSAAHTHTGAAHTHSTTIASAGSGTAKEHIPIYFNVKYLIRVI